MGLTGESEWDEAVEKQMQAWRQDPHWADQAPRIESNNLEAGFCVLDATAILALPPSAAFGIICDPDNRRVFKSIKSVNYRHVLKEEGDCKLVEVEQNAIWQFLFLSGTFAVRTLVEEDRSTHTSSYRLSKPGFMKKFQGRWQMDAFPVPPSIALQAQTAQAGSSLVPTEAPTAFDSALQPSVNPAHHCGPSLPWYGPGTRIATRVTLRQEMEPSILPPPWVAGYLRGITTKAMLEMLTDFQIEAARLRYGLPEDCNVKSELQKIVKGAKGAQNEGSPRGGHQEEMTGGEQGGAHEENNGRKDDPPEAQGTKQVHVLAQGSGDGMGNRQQCAPAEKSHWEKKDAQRVGWEIAEKDGLWRAGLKPNGKRVGGEKQCKHACMKKGARLPEKWKPLVAK